MISALNILSILIIISYPKHTQTNGCFIIVSPLPEMLPAESPSSNPPATGLDPCPGHSKLLWPGSLHSVGLRHQAS